MDMRDQSAFCIEICLTNLYSVQETLDGNHCLGEKKAISFPDHRNSAGEFLSNGFYYILHLSTFYEDHEDAFCFFISFNLYRNSELPRNKIKRN